MAPPGMPAMVRIPCRSRRVRRRVAPVIFMVGRDVRPLPCRDPAEAKKKPPPVRHRRGQSQIDIQNPRGARASATTTTRARPRDERVVVPEGFMSEPRERAKKRRLSRRQMGYSLFPDFMRRLERQGRHGAAEKLGHPIDAELMQIFQTHDKYPEANRRVEGATGDSAHRHRAG